MSHIFDTEEPRPQRTILIDAALQILAPMKYPNGYLRSLTSFGGVVRTYTDEDLGIGHLIDTLKATPGIAVATGTREFDVTGVGAQEALSTVELILYFASGHQRDRYTGRHAPDNVARANDHADPGLHIMMEHALELMYGRYPQATKTTVKQIRIVRERELATAEPMTIWVQEYRVKLFTPAPIFGKGREWRTPPDPLTEVYWRNTPAQNETVPPDAPVDPRTVDVDTQL